MFQNLRPALAATALRELQAASQTNVMGIPCLRVCWRKATHTEVFNQHYKVCIGHIYLTHQAEVTHIHSSMLKSLQESFWPSEAHNPDGRVPVSLSQLHQAGPHFRSRQRELTGAVSKKARISLGCNGGLETEINPRRLWGWRGQQTPEQNETKSREPEPRAGRAG